MTIKNEPIDTRLILSALWITLLFVYAYVDIFAFFRAELPDDRAGARLEML